MSKITGVSDFRDLLDKYGVDFMKKINIYIGYSNYLLDMPVDTSSLNEYKDWAFLFHYTIYAKSIYEKLGSGNVILYERDHLSMQEDVTAGSGENKRVMKLRKKFRNELEQMGYSIEEIDRISRYQFELEGVQNGESNERRYSEVAR